MYVNNTKKIRVKQEKYIVASLNRSCFIFVSVIFKKFRHINPEEIVPCYIR